MTETVALGYSSESIQSVRAFSWIPTWQDLDGIQKSLHHCADESSLRIARVNLLIAVCQLRNMRDDLAKIYQERLLSMCSLQPECKYKFQIFCYIVSPKMCLNKCEIVKYQTSEAVVWVLNWWPFYH